MWSNTWVYASQCSLNHQCPESYAAGQLFFCHGTAEVDASTSFLVLESGIGRSVSSSTSVSVTADTHGREARVLLWLNWIVDSLVVVVVRAMLSLRYVRPSAATMMIVVGTMPCHEIDLGWGSQRTGYGWQSGLP